MVTVILIAVTAIVSLLGFYVEGFLGKTLFNAFNTYHRRQYYRLLTYGFVHGSWGHLFFNMLTLYFFGTYLEQYFTLFFGQPLGIVLYVLMYLSAVVISTLADLVKYKNTESYNAVGASGAVSAVLFASVLFDPRIGIYIYFIPVPIPGYIFAPLYLIYCQWMAKRNRDNIGHTAHFWGAVYGFIFPIICHPAIFSHFLYALGVR